jgi:hypothetical protein
MPLQFPARLFGLQPNRDVNADARKSAEDDLERRDWPANERMLRICKGAYAKLTETHEAARGGFAMSSLDGKRRRGQSGRDARVCQRQIHQMTDTWFIGVLGSLVRTAGFR